MSGWASTCCLVMADTDVGSVVTYDIPILKTLKAPRIDADCFKTLDFLWL